MKRRTPHVDLPDGIVPVYAQIDGAKAKRSLRMALDTGASYTMAPPEKLVAAGYRIPTSQRKMIGVFTASGIEYVPVVRVSCLKSMGIAVKDIDVVCHALPAESPVEGLLGLNFLAHVPAFVEFLRKLGIA